MANLVTAIEYHLSWIADCVTYMQGNHVKQAKAGGDAQAGWVDEVRNIADETLVPRANSWYIGANVPGKPRVFMAYPAGLNNYRNRCDQIVADGYTGIRFSTKHDGKSIKQSAQREGLTGARTVHEPGERGSASLS